MKEKYICDECYDCYWFWQNNDTECECQGNKEPCHEFVLTEEVL